MIIVCTPNNPTGRVLSKSEVDALSKFAKDKDVIILSDEVYEKICYVDEFLSPGAFGELANKTITVNGFSKAYAMTGWRLGYLAAPDKIVNAINKLYAHTITGTSPFIQEAAIVALDCFDDVERMRRQYFSRKEYFIHALSEIPGIKVQEPEGAFYS